MPNRREFLQGLAAATAGVSLAGGVDAATSRSEGLKESARKFLIKGGYVVTMDRTLGDLETGDVLIDSGKIVAVGKNLPAQGAQVVNARAKLVLPGFIDTHRHTWETCLRGVLADGDFPMYFKIILGTLGPLYRPEDVHIGNLLGSLGCLNAGITTLLDWSHIMNTPEHADAAIKGLKDSGIRGVFAHGDPVTGWLKPQNEQRHLEDIKRIQKQYFSSDDQLLTLAMAVAGPEFYSLEATIDDIKLAREMGIRVSMHVGVPGVARFRAVTRLKEAGMLGPDITHIHTLHCTDDELKMIADSGGTISTSPATEIISGHGFPSVQRWLRYGLRPSLSVDNETRIPPDLFTQMRALLSSDRELETIRVAKEGGRPTLLPTRDVLEFGTVQGARATGLDRKVGTIAPGKRADVILIDLDDIAVIPRIKDPVGTALLIAHPGNVSWVFVDGIIRKREGKLVGANIENIRKRAQSSYEYLYAKAGLS
jgi:5-methylthioadenosine/S-adenosylhomocysteine deaminase